MCSNRGQFMADGRDYCLKKNHWEVFGRFRTPGALSGPGTVKKRPGMENRSRGSSVDLWGPTLYKICDVGCQGVPVPRPPISCFLSATSGPGGLETDLPRGWFFIPSRLSTALGPMRAPRDRKRPNTARCDFPTTSEIWFPGDAWRLSTPPSISISRPWARLHRPPRPDNGPGFQRR